jgi:hypothetical protein
MCGAIVTGFADACADKPVDQAEKALLELGGKGTSAIA